jgi:hypothetical protein
MKIRLGFVANSSSSSFAVVVAFPPNFAVTIENIKAYLKLDSLTHDEIEFVGMELLNQDDFDSAADFETLAQKLAYRVDLKDSEAVANFLAKEIYDSMRIDLAIQNPNSPKTEMIKLPTADIYAFDGNVIPAFNRVFQEASYFEKDVKAIYNG